MSQLTDDFFSINPSTMTSGKTLVSPNKIPLAVNGDDLSSSISPAAISGQFDTSYDKATSGYAPFQGDHSGIDQLQALYGNVGDAFDVSGTVAALDKSRRTNLLTGEAASNDAASKFTESQSPSINSGTASSLIRARSLLPFLQSDTQAASDEGKYQDSAKQAALSTGADIASKLADLQQNYTNSLATYNATKANFGLDFAKGQTGAALSASGTQNNALQLALQARQLTQNQTQFNLTRQDTLNAQNAALQAAKQKANTPTTPASDYYFVNNVGQRISL